MPGPMDETMLNNILGFFAEGDRVSPLNPNRNLGLHSPAFVAASNTIRNLNRDFVQTLQMNQILVQQNNNLRNELTVAQHNVFFLNLRVAQLEMNPGQELNPMRLIHGDQDQIQNGNGQMNLHQNFQPQMNALQANHGQIQEAAPVNQAQNQIQVVQVGQVQDNQENQRRRSFFAPNRPR